MKIYKGKKKSPRNQFLDCVNDVMGEKIDQLNKTGENYTNTHHENFLSEAVNEVLINFASQVNTDLMIGLISEFDEGICENGELGDEARLRIYKRYFNTLLIHEKDDEFIMFVDKAFRSRKHSVKQFSGYEYRKWFSVTDLENHINRFKSIVRDAITSLPQKRVDYIKENLPEIFND